jgi:hypothetical protein
LLIHRKHFAERLRACQPTVIAFLLAIGGLVIGNGAILAARPGIAAGAWPESEAVTCAVLAGAALCLFGQAMGAAWGKSSCAWRSPLVILPLVLAGWSALSAGFATFPGTALLGAPQNGLGAAWFVAQAAFTAAALEVRQHRRALDLLAALAALTTGIAVFCNLRHLPWLQPLLVKHGLQVKIPLFSFNEHLAYPAMALAAIGAGQWAENKRRWAAVLLAVAAVALVASRNRTAMAAAAVIVPLAVMAWLYCGFGLRHWQIARRPRRTTILAAIAVTVVAVVPLLAIHFADLSQAPFSLLSRQILMKVLDPSLFESPTSVVFGHGWGHYQEFLARNVAGTGVSLFTASKTGLAWADLTRDEFHSHNALLEAFFSTGLPGAILTLAIPVAVVAMAAQGRKGIALAFVLGWIAVDSMWFSLPSMLAVQALAVAALGGDRPEADNLPRQSWGAAALCLALSIALVGAAGWQRHQSQGLDAVRDCLSGRAVDGCATLPIPTDPRGSDLGLAALLGDTADSPRSPMLARVLAEGQRRCRLGCALPLSIALANRHVESAFASPPAADFSPAAWQEEEERIIRRAPGRLDLLTPYLNWLVTVGDEATARKILAEAAQADAGHPVVLWFAGALLINHGADGQRRGLAMMRDALDKGLERFMPVPEDLKGLVRGAAP